MTRSILLSILLSAALPSPAAMIQGRVIGVLDGDTITLLGSNLQQYRIRLAEIDAPEKNQAYGQTSKWALSALAFGKQASADCPKFDRYKRHVCHVYVQEKHINAVQVETGMAWVYTAYAPKRSPLLRLERNAKESGLGLWSDRHPTPPWDFRRAKH
jgi:endonuclease YncB( thermonuclease family)